MVIDDAPHVVLAIRGPEHALVTAIPLDPAPEKTKALTERGKSGTAP